MRKALSLASRPAVSAVLAALLAVAAVVVLVVRPAGAQSAADAALESDARGARVLTAQPWGDGMLVLTGRDAAQGLRALTLAFVLDSGRGWRVVASAEQSAATTDVQVGSLLVTTSRGGAGQPPWSAVYGELSEPTVARVEVLWRREVRTASAAANAAYLVVRRGVHSPVQARFLGADGAELRLVAIQP